MGLGSGWGWKGQVVEFFEDLEGIAAATTTRAALVDTQERIGMILDLMPIGLLIHQKMGILFANQATADFLGSTQEALVGKHIFDFLTPEDKKRVEQLFEDVFDSSTPHQLAGITIKCADLGMRTFRFTSARLPWEGTPACQILMQDITKETRKSQQLQNLLATDPLTGAQNRRSFVDYVSKIKKAGNDLDAGIVFLDVDHFKAVNDTYGHEAGDLVLRHVVLRCEYILAREMLNIDESTPRAMLARMGGEEFAIFVPDGGEDYTRMLAEQIRFELENTPIRIDGTPIDVSASFGFVTFDVATANLDDLLSKADEALYTAKNSGRNMVVGTNDLTMQNMQGKAGISRRATRIA